MKKKCYRYFSGFLTSQEKWLNKMAQKGFRLVKAGKLLYAFESCSPAQYQYAVEIVADKSKKDSQRYKEFLEGCGYKVFYKNINLNYSLGKVRFRPWAEGSGKIATNATTFNKELLIVEKENDGKPFQLHTTVSDKIGYMKKWRNIWLTYFAMFALMALLFAFKIPLVSIILGSIGVLTLIPVIAYQVQVGKLKKNLETEE